MSKKSLDEILAKPIGELNEYDKSILRARRSYLSEKQRKDYSEFLGFEEKTVKASDEKDVKKSKKK